MGAIYFLFTVRSSSSRLGCGQKHKPVTVPELPGEVVATSTIDHQHHAPSALPPQGPHLPLGHETDARPASSPKSPRTGSSPYPETQRPARSAAQHSAQPRPGRLRRRLRPRRPGRADGRASERAESRARRGPGAAEEKLAPSRHARASRGSPWRRSGPRRQVRPTYSTPGTGGRAGRGTSRAHDAAEGPTWRSPGARRGTERGCGPARSPKSPRRRGRGSATAHHVPGPRWRLKAALLGAPGRRAGGRAGAGS